MHTCQVPAGQSSIADALPCTAASPPTEIPLGSTVPVLGTVAPAARAFQLIGLP